MPFAIRRPVQRAAQGPQRAVGLSTRERQIANAFEDAVAAMKDSIDVAAVRQMIATSLPQAVNVGGFIQNLQPMVDAISAEVAASGVMGIRELTAGLPNRVVGNFGFDVKDPRAVAWARQRAGELVRQVSDEQTQTIRKIVTRSVEEGLTVQQTAQQLKQTVGLHDRWAQAVDNFHTNELQRLIKTGLSEEAATAKAANAAEKYHQRLVKARAQNIARTEIQTAQNQGRWLSWAQGVEGGYVSPTAQKKWQTGSLTVAAGRKQVCEICRPIADEKVAWDQPFSIGVMMPPAHPSCRCTAVIVPVDIDEVRRRLEEARAAEAVAASPATVDAPQPVTPQIKKGEFGRSDIMQGLEKYGVDPSLVPSDDLVSNIKELYKKGFDDGLQFFDVRDRVRGELLDSRSFNQFVDGLGKHYPRGDAVDLFKVAFEHLDGYEQKLWQSVAHPNEVAKTVRKLEKFVEKNPVTINITEQNFLKVLEDGRFKTQFETGKSKGSYDPRHRKMVEKQKLGVPEDLADEARPIYGSIAKAEKVDDASSYGAVRVVLRDEVKDRATLTANDSFTTVVSSPVRSPRIGSLELSVESGTVNFPNPSGFKNYVECQIFGGVRVTDIAEVWVDSIDVARLFAKNIGDNPIQIFVRGQTNPSAW